MSTLNLVEDRHDRQVRAFGAPAQRRLRGLTVAVVGVGGAGSLLVQGLAHLGIGRLIVVDPDHIEATNLSRVVGARPDDVTARRAKVAVAARMVAAIDAGIGVHSVEGSVLDSAVWCELRCADIILGAVDGHAPRWALNALAVQYARCYIDVGVQIDSETAPVRLAVAGHVATVTPGGPCLLCLCGYDPRRVAAELDPTLADAKRRAGYLSAAPQQPAPAVVFLNQAVTAVALGEVLNQVAGWRAVHRYVLVDLTTPATSQLDAERDPTCQACGVDSARGLADAGGVPLQAYTSALASLRPAVSERPAVVADCSTLETGGDDDAV
ncbi:MAG: hypothetical protein QOE51_1662 [Actinoplanes sp.]|nr:hypothetical protein [Actinoplanes sp.]